MNTTIEFKDMVTLLSTLDKGHPEDSDLRAKVVERLTAEVDERLTAEVDAKG